MVYQGRPAFDIRLLVANECQCETGGDLSNISVFNIEQFVHCLKFKQAGTPHPEVKSPITSQKYLKLVSV